MSWNKALFLLCSTFSPTHEKFRWWETPLGHFPTFVVARAHSQIGTWFSLHYQCLLSWSILWMMRCWSMLVGPFPTSLMVPMRRSKLLLSLAFLGDLSSCLCILNLQCRPSLILSDDRFKPQLFVLSVTSWRVMMSKPRSLSTAEPFQPSWAFFPALEKRSEKRLVGRYPISPLETAIRYSPSLMPISSPLWFTCFNTENSRQRKKLVGQSAMRLAVDWRDQNRFAILSHRCLCIDDFI